MRPSPRPGVLLVATRELRWMRKDGIALLLAIGVPLIGFALLSWTFSKAVIRDLRVTVVDSDRTPTSMSELHRFAHALADVLAGVQAHFFRRYASLGLELGRRSLATTGRRAS
jgi:hypothetical protein